MVSFFGIFVPEKSHCDNLWFQTRNLKVFLAVNTFSTTFSCFCFVFAFGFFVLFCFGFGFLLFIYLFIYLFFFFLGGGSLFVQARRCHFYYTPFLQHLSHFVSYFCNENCFFKNFSHSLYMNLRPVFDWILLWNFRFYRQHSHIYRITLTVYLKK